MGDARDHEGRHVQAFLLPDTPCPCRAPLVEQCTTEEDGHLRIAYADPKGVSEQIPNGFIEQTNVICICHLPSLKQVVGRPCRRQTLSDHLYLTQGPQPFAASACHNHRK
jgi:hypothetical protein